MYASACASSFSQGAREGRSVVFYQKMMEKIRKEEIEQEEKREAQLGVFHHKGRRIGSGWSL